jgi:hypothetical protein
MPDAFMTVTVTIPAGQSVSNAFAMGEAIRIVRLEMPAAWSVAEDVAPVLTFLASQDNATFRDAHIDERGEAVPVAAGRSVSCAPGLTGVKHIKLRSGTAAAPVVQAAARQVIVVLQNPPPPVEVNVTVSSPPP